MQPSPTQSLYNDHDANRLYAASEDTIDKQNNPGAHAVTVNHGDTRFTLPPDGHRLITLRPTFSQIDVDRVLTPPPFTTTGGS